MSAPTDPSRHEAALPAAPVPASEARRLQTLRSLDILDTPAEERFDRLTRIARRLFGVPIARLSLVDEHRQWFKSRCGAEEIAETPRDAAFCAHAILAPELMVVEDALADPRFRDNPSVTGAPHVRFYAGCPLLAANGEALGTLCIHDTRPRRFSDEERRLMYDLAAIAQQELQTAHLVATDELTGVANRRGFEQLASQALAACRRRGEDAVILFFDLDRFKQINDSFGHAAGDAALADFARALRETFRESDVVGRLGGDEFAVLVTQAPLEDVPCALERLMTRVAALDEGRPYRIRYSVGASSIGMAKGGNLALALKAADERMYRHKTSVAGRSAG